MADRVLPLVLAGPIVRRVEPRACSVWIALSESVVDVRLTIWRGVQMAGPAAGSVASGDTPVASSSQSTRQFGKRLHVALVTIALAPAVPPLEPGTLYAYDLQLGGRGGLKQLGFLDDQGVDAKDTSNRPIGPNLALGYASGRLPSFVTPPARIENTCFVHASCRRSDAPDHDALPALDRLIGDALTAPLERPQQLFLTGDQIYADDLCAELLTMLSPIAHAVIGSDEKLAFRPPKDGTDWDPDGLEPDRPAVDTDINTQNFPPGKRRQQILLKQAGFTTGDPNHLLGFGEYVAMYLAVWNPRVWDLPDTDAVPLGLRQFRAGVPLVARAHANVATYMIFDDHDVTDDWNLSQKWRNRVYTKPMGVQVIRNALCAYAVFQGWGNDPAAFTAGRNAELLHEIGDRFGAMSGPYPIGALGPLHKLLGLITATLAEQVVWNYQVPSPRSLMVVLDTRTRRTFAGQGYQPPDLLGQNRDAQLPAGPFTDGREMLFLVSAAPVIGPDVIDSLGWPAAQVAIDAKNRGHGLDGSGIQRANIGSEKYDAEGWSANEVAREEFLKRIATYPVAAILSGDVHFACTVVMDHYRKGVPRPSRIVQLTSSPARNEFKAIVKLLVRQNPVLQQVAGAFSISRLAWAGPSPLVVPSPAVVSPGRRGRLVRKPSLIPAAGWPAGTTFPADKPPDWRWRLTVVRDERHEAELPPLLRQRLLSSSEELSAGHTLEGYRAITARHQQGTLERFEHLRQLIFKSNIGVVRVLRDAGGRLRLRHSLFSSDAPGSARFAEGTRHEMPLAPSSEPAPELKTR